MRRIKLLLLAIAALVTHSPCAGQTTNDGGQWNAVFLNGNLGRGNDSRLRWWFDGHLRLQDDADGFFQSIVRPGVGWKLCDNATAWAGYAWIRTSPAAAEDIDEQRFWQQVTWSKQAGVFQLAARSRLEQRFIEESDDVAWRFRQLVRWQHDLPGFERLTFVNWDEYFANFNDTDVGLRSGFDQNRVFVGFGFRAPRIGAGRTEVGYLNQVVNVPAGPNVSNHILSVNFFR